MKQSSDPLSTSSSLLRGLKDWNNQEIWRRFFETYGGFIFNMASKCGLTPTEAEDVRQDIILSVMKSMKHFEYNRDRGSFKGWLIQLTRWRIADQLNKRDFCLDHGRATSPTRDGTATVERCADPAKPEFEKLSDLSYESNLLRSAARNLQPKIDPKHFEIFELVFFKQWPVAKVAAHVGVSVGLVYLTKHRVRNLMKKEVLRLRKDLV